MSDAPSSQGFFGSIVDRFRGAVTGQFFVAWILLNWKVPVFLIYGDLLPSARIEEIVALYPNWSNRTWWLFLCPLFSTATYLLCVEAARSIEHQWRLGWAEAAGRRELDQRMRLANYSKYGVDLENLVSGIRRQSIAIKKSLKLATEAKASEDAKRGALAGYNSISEIVDLLSADLFPPPPQKNLTLLAALVRARGNAEKRKLALGREQDPSKPAEGIESE